MPDPCSAVGPWWVLWICSGSGVARSHILTGLCWLLPAEILCWHIFVPCLAREELVLQVTLSTARAVHCSDPLLLHRADVWAVSQEGTGCFGGHPPSHHTTLSKDIPFRGGRLKRYLSSPPCNFHPVLGHCSSRRRQFQTQPPASSLLLPAHSENLNLWLDNMTWCYRSTAKASLSQRCGKSRSACHAAVAVHRR